MKILFVCSGNSGRSPMAQFIMQKLVADAGLSEKISVDSAASKPTNGEILHQGIAAKLGMEKIPFTGHIARTITPADYAANDLILCMDAGNVEQVKAIVGGDPDKKISTLLDKDIPWDKKGFATTFDDIMRGCKMLLEKIS
ncbi:MAG: low molecular weight phosphotyrosine protein phosphatase [Selenomonadaceae bacterium]|nr:low molecular weight phosphotyrosine protein phosphatase [Selenomonadaceae bacterium]MBQ3726738.1 low molecular weight phosphotyrosine protein phosphatase [Selenomonadaceae bacterium]MBQ9498122.1 low molecular weight phosphotyrosine protein phosphatase [Selenomonadaceae bacterium]